MLPSWSPRKPDEPQQWDIIALGVREEAHRDALLVQLMLRQDGVLRETLLRKLHYIKLPGAYGLILFSPSGARNVMYNITARGLSHEFHHQLIAVARQYYLESRWDYAWISDRRRYDGGTDRSRDSGGSQTQLGKSMRTNFRRIADDLANRTFKEKGVTYE